MAEYVFSYTQGTNLITCTRRDGSVVDWRPNIPGLEMMARFAKRVFYADLVKDMQVDPGVTGTVSVITANFGGEHSNNIRNPHDVVDTDSINTIKTQPLEAFKRDMKNEMSPRGTYVENPNIPKSSTSGVNPKQFSNATEVYYDSGESPSDICLNPDVTHLVDSAYCLDPASGTRHPKKDFINDSFSVDNSITGGLFGFPTYYTFTTIPVDPPKNCQVRYTLNPIVLRNPNPLDVAFNIADQKNTTFNAGYSNAVKNNFITTKNHTPTRANNEIIKKLVIKESGDCAQIWSILCELIIRIEKTRRGATPAEKQVAFDELRAKTLLITTDSVVFSRAIPFCSASDNGGMAGIDRGCFTQKYFTLGDTDYPLAYTTQMDREKKRITDQNIVNINIFQRMSDFFRRTDNYPYFYRLISVVARRPSREIQYDPKLYRADCIVTLCETEIVKIRALNAALTATNPRLPGSVGSEANLTQFLKDDFHTLSGHACLLYFSKDANNNYMVHDDLHTEIQKCLRVPENMKASAGFYTIGPDGRDPSPDQVARLFESELVQALRGIALKPDKYGFLRVKSDDGHFGEFKIKEDSFVSIVTTKKTPEFDDEFSYYDSLVAYMIFEDGKKSGYAKEKDTTIYIQPAVFLKKYDTFIDRYKREPTTGHDIQPRHDDVERLLAPMKYAMDQDVIPENLKDFNIDMRRIGVGCLRVILKSFLVKKEIYKDKLEILIARSGVQQHLLADQAELEAESEVQNKSERETERKANAYRSVERQKQREMKVSQEEQRLLDFKSEATGVEKLISPEEQRLEYLKSDNARDTFRGYKSSVSPTKDMANGVSKAEDQRRRRSVFRVNKVYPSDNWAKSFVEAPHVEGHSGNLFDDLNEVSSQTRYNRLANQNNLTVEGPDSHFMGLTTDDKHQAMIDESRSVFQSPPRTPPYTPPYTPPEDLSQTTVTADLESLIPKQKNQNSIQTGLIKQGLGMAAKEGVKEKPWWEGGKRRTMKAKKYLKNNRKKTIRKSNKKTIRKNKKNNRKKTRKSKY
jgi:hypothetical protein